MSEAEAEASIVSYAGIVENPATHTPTVLILVIFFKSVFHANRS